MVAWDSYKQVSDDDQNDIYAQRYGHPKEAKEGFNLCAQCDAGLVNVAGDFPSANALTTCDTCGIANSEANPQNSSCVCKDGHHLDPVTFSTQSSGTPPLPLTMSYSDCQTYGDGNIGTENTANYARGCIVGNGGVDVYYNNHATGGSCTTYWNCVIKTGGCTACAAGTW